MTTATFEQRVQYERLSSGLDVALLRTHARDLVIARIALGTGSYAVYDRQEVAALLSDLLPAGTKSMKRSKVREQFELLGASVGVSIGATHIYASITSRRESFIPALALLADVLARPVFTEKEFAESKTSWLTSLENEKEGTMTQADIALSRTLFDKGHPQWSHTTTEKIRAMTRVEHGDVSRLYPSLLSTVGGLITVAGDIDPERLVRDIERVMKVLPSRKLSLAPTVHPEKIRHTDGGKDLVVTCKDKMNIDTLFGIPLTLTKYDDDFEPLAIGVAILGSSSSSRLFNELRTRKSLTYGAYASLDGFSDGYPGYLGAHAVFPSDVFLKGREALREVVQTFIAKGVSARELTKRKEEVLGRHVVGLSTTASLAGVVFDTLLAGRPLSYLDTFSERLTRISLKRVNDAITTHLHYEDAVTAAAGGIDRSGKPLA
jgi:zinc protease